MQKQKQQQAKQKVTVEYLYRLVCCICTILDIYFKIMKCRILLLISMLASIAVGNAQEPTTAPSTSSIPTSFDVVDSNSTAPSESPNDDSQSPSPSTSGGGDPSDCAGETCDKNDINACSCRPGLECRSRNVGGFSICSQVPRKRRNRLSAALGFGGAGARDGGARIPN